MQLRFFTIPALDPGPAAEEVSAFLSNHRIIEVSREFVANGPNSFWAICVAYTRGSALADSTAQKRPPKDYREILSAEDFATFANLRTLRKQLAEREGVPAYAIFTNEQLATMVRDRVTTPAALAAVPGVGPARVERHAGPFLAILQQQAQAPANAAP